MVSGSHCDLVEHSFAGKFLIPHHLRLVLGSQQLCQTNGNRSQASSNLSNTYPLNRLSLQLRNLADPPVKSNAAFAGGLLMGISAAILGLVITLFFDLFTEFGLICYLSPAVGWLIGKAIRKGSRGAGGLRYQIAAIILTYFATALPTTSYYFFFAEQKRAQQANTWLAPGWERLYARCAISGSLSPFLSVQRGVIDIIGLAILFAGLYVTYRMTAAGHRVP